MNDKQLAIFQTIASKYETPSYIFDVGELSMRVGQIRERLPGDTKLCFAMKANPFLTGTMAGLTDRLEVCSPGEYEICIRNKVDAERIVVSGVNKTLNSMEQILSYSQGAGIYTIESPLHYQILKQCAGKVNRRLKVLLRLSAGNQFGMDESVLTQVLSVIRRDNILDVIGIHYYGGTQKTFKKMQKELEQLEAMGRRLRTEYNLDDLELEYGPGLPVTYFEGEQINTGNMDDIKPLEDLLRQLSKVAAYPHISIELGRYLAAPCGYYLTTVMDQKLTDGTGYLIVDGGIHQINYYGQMLGMKKPYLQLLKCEKNNDSCCLQHENTWTVCGSLCTANDILVRQADIGPVQIGDILIFERCGAYSVTEGMAMFLSRELPQILLLYGDGTIEVMRNKIEMNIFNTRMEEK